MIFFLKYFVLVVIVPLGFGFCETFINSIDIMEWSFVEKVSWKASHLGWGAAFGIVLWKDLEHDAKKKKKG